MKLLPPLVRRLSSLGPRLAESKANLTSISPSEREHFNHLATTWWDTNGSQRILHKMNLIRMDFINETIKKNIKINENVESEHEKAFIPGWNYENLLPKEIASRIKAEQDVKISENLAKMELDCLDVGCGGGILSESLARLPIVRSVRGIDLSPEVIRVANEHKQLDPLIRDKINYELTSVEEIAQDDMYDVVTLMEILEHVDHPSSVLQTALKHVKPEGYLFLSTINRDFISWLTTIFFGEHVLKIVPLGTHTYSKYINNTEISEFVEELGNQFEVIDSKGCIYLPLHGWKFTSSPDIGNYFMALKRKSTYIK